MIGKNRDKPVHVKRELRVGTSVSRHLYLVDPGNTPGKHEEEIGFTIGLEDGPILVEAFNAAQWGPGDPPPPKQVYALRDAGRSVNEGRYLVRFEHHEDLWVWGYHGGHPRHGGGRLHTSADPQPWAEAVKEAIVLVPVDWHYSILADKPASGGFLDQVDWSKS